MFIFVKGFFTYDGTAGEAGVAGTHATRLDRVSPYRGFESFCQRAAARRTGITIWIEWWM